MPDRLIRFMYESWATFDAQTDGLTVAELTARHNGGSAIAWTLGHLTTMLDSWINTRFQGLAPNPVISDPNFRNGGNGEAPDWPAIRAAVDETRRAARKYLDAKLSPDLDQVIPYDGSIKDLRPIGLRLSYAIMRITAHHLMHAGEVATIRTSLGYPEGPSGQMWARSLA